MHACASGLRRSTTVAVHPSPWRPTGLDGLGASSGGLGGSFHSSPSRPTSKDVLGASFLGVSFGGLGASFHASPSRLADAVGSDSFALRASPQGAASPSDTPTGGSTPARAVSPSPSGKERGPRTTAALETLPELITNPGALLLLPGLCGACSCLMMSRGCLLCRDKAVL
jgi:hypothetical protein